MAGRVAAAGGEVGEAAERVDERGPADLAPVSSTAIALTVKSRRTRSSSIVSPKATSGLRTHAVVRVGPERGDLDGRAVPSRADRAERDAGVPRGIGPALQQGEHRSGRASVVKSRSVCYAAEQRVAHAAADEVEPVSGRGEPGRELVGDRVDRTSVHRRILLRTASSGGRRGQARRTSLGTVAQPATQAGGVAMTCERG